MRWSRERDFDVMIEASASDNGLDADLVRGLIGHESQFSPTAIGDDGKSIGLMQVQTQAAKDVGFVVTEKELLDPAVNIAAGCAYLARQISLAGGSVDGGISAYNGGWRPALGYGRPLSTGSFRNQSYVDSVKTNWHYFRSLQPTLAMRSRAPGGSDFRTRDVLIIGFVGLLGIVAWLVFGR